ncbi:hypothetical protein ICL16_30755 [Iningainema sp. BLCCT55]|uniref:Uncharacterized protein n=1 Tax=Iningainema tapete BLCC-T55 TaxID=2748662 RepID=A0A8J6XQE7_9CYAN|nr:hypothetical protein [Iningainema tapete]MBD2776320.1 hypothetical protein [Iningainema tapete BLCC-T55]
MRMHSAIATKSHVNNLELAVRMVKLEPLKSPSCVTSFRLNEQPDISIKQQSIS